MSAQERAQQTLSQLDKEVIWHPILYTWHDSLVDVSLYRVQRHVLKLVMSANLTLSADHVSYL